MRLPETLQSMRFLEEPTLWAHADARWAIGVLLLTVTD